MAVSAGARDPSTSQWALANVLFTFLYFLCADCGQLDLQPGEVTDQGRANRFDSCPVVFRGTATHEDRHVPAKKTAKIEQFALQIWIVRRINDAQRYGFGAVLNRGARDLRRRQAWPEIDGSPSLLRGQRRSHHRAEFMKLPLRCGGDQGGVGTFASVLPRGIEKKSANRRCREMFVRHLQNPILPENAKAMCKR